MNNEHKAHRVRKKKTIEQYFAVEHFMNDVYLFTYLDLIIGLYLLDLLILLILIFTLFYLVGLLTLRLLFIYIFMVVLTSNSLLVC